MALNISKRALQTYRDNGLLPYSNIGGKFFYKEVDIQQILEEGLIKKRKTVCLVFIHGMDAQNIQRRILKGYSDIF